MKDLARAIRGAATFAIMLLLAEFWKRQNQHDRQEQSRSSK
jgi:hypothetical protein